MMSPRSMLFGRILRVLLAVGALIFAGMSADAIEPEQREAVVINGRVWEGYEYKEMFLPSTLGTMTLMAGGDSAIVYVRTLEYYWPLSRQVYVDFERQRDIVEGELVVRRGSTEVAREPLQLYAMLYPEGAVNGNASLLWGAEAERAYAEHQENESRFSREYTSALRARSEYERRLLESGAARSRGEAIEPIDPPPPLPQPSLRLVTKPALAFRVNLPPGDYTATVEQNGQTVEATERQLHVVEAFDRTVLVADVVPVERWTRPLATNIEAARIYVRPGTVFYMTVTEADRFLEDDYLSVVSPQTEPVSGRSIWVRRKPAALERLQIKWDGSESAVLAREPLKVDQTRGSAFGYQVRKAGEGEEPDLEAFTIDVPGHRAATRGTIATSEEGPASFRREIVVVHPRRSALSLALAFLPFAGYLALVGSRRLGMRRRGYSARR
jgi:hypothetical protein